MKEVFKKEMQELEKGLKGMDVENIFFVACGGSMAALSPGQYFIDKEIGIPTFLYTSNEFVHRNPKRLNEKSIVITRSHSGNTPETVEATKFARKKGAKTIAISMIADSPLCEEAEYKVTYEYGEGVKVKDGDYAAFWRLFFKLAYIITDDEKYQRGFDQIHKLQEAFDVNKEETKDIANQFGKELKREKIIYTMASGEYYSIAYSFTSCLLMEMLWINSNAIHSGEYFHGPFEITDYDVPFLIILGSGSSRPLDERAVKFAKKFSEKVYTLDTSKFNLSMFDDDLRDYFSVPVCGAVIRQYANGLAEHTGHPLSVRRYMWKMEY